MKNAQGNLDSQALNNVAFRLRGAKQRGGQSGFDLAYSAMCLVNLSGRHPRFTVSKTSTKRWFARAYIL